MPPSDWNASLYDQAAHFVTDYGKALLDDLKPQAGERILDVGCGTGHLTQQISASGATVIGIDSSQNMVETARSTYPEIEFVQADAAHFEFADPFDAIFSNAALHWVSNAKGAVVSMARALKPGGRFVIEMGGKGNVSILVGGLFQAFQEMGLGEVGHRWFFPSIGEYSSMLESEGIEPTLAWLFERPTPLLGESGVRDWFALFGDAIQTTVPKEEFERAVERAESILRPQLYKDGVWIADYRRLRIIGRKIS
ncbi:MAG: hypothetical protein BGO01_05605 [Armatimonadetes bacterium 55-13]|nr:methyltransferase domain-containing protein [Armatimonadota bacterium]OJU61549.1 MAG: hypothetical protein BGO01_05605 [Armatimonadetes bacterium 55-13]